MNPNSSRERQAIPKQENSLPNSIKGSKLTQMDANPDSGRTTATKNTFSKRKRTRDEERKQASKLLLNTMNLTGLVSTKGYRLEQHYASPPQDPKSPVSEHESPEDR